MIFSVVGDIICGLARRVYNSSYDHEAKGAAHNPSECLSHGRLLASPSNPGHVLAAGIEIIDLVVFLCRRFSLVPDA
jgi:hypothetical protein